MFILSRSIDESIQIGQEIVIKVLSIREGAVRIGIEAPRHIPVHRHEVHEAIRRGFGHSRAVRPAGRGGE